MTAPRSPQLREVRKGLTWRSLDFFYKLIEGDHEYAERRLFLLGLMVVVFTLMGRATEQVEPYAFLQPTLNAMPELLRFLVSLLVSLLHPQTFRHILPPLIGVILAVRVASNYVRDLFELPDFSMARQYLLAAMLGMDYPAIKINASGYDVEGAYDKETNPIPKIGGPGFVSVGTGYVAVFERVGGPSKVAGAGSHFIRRFENLREVIDLRDQFRKRDGLKVFTKDGIQVTVRNVEVAFRVHTQSRLRTHKEIYPFSIGAVRRLAYNKTVGPNGPSVWTESVTGAAVGKITGFITSHVLDDLVAKPHPDAPDPRDKLKAIFTDKKTRDQFRAMGVDLLWVSIGHIETPKDVVDQRISAWRALWLKDEQVEMAKGDANKLRLMEYARALARIEYLENFTKGVPLMRESAPPIDFVLLQIAEVLNTGSRSQSYGYSARNERLEEITTLRVLQKLFERGSSNEPIDGSLPLLPS